MTPHVCYMPEDAVDQELSSLVRTPGFPNEKKILLLLARRYLVLGANAYGPLRLHDGRDSRLNAFEEVADAAFYLAKDALERLAG